MWEVSSNQGKAYTMKRHTQLAASILELAQDREWLAVMHPKDQILAIGKIIEDHVKEYVDDHVAKQIAAYIANKATTTFGSDDGN